MRPPRFEAITVAVRGSLGRRSSLENRVRALSSLSAKGTAPEQRKTDHEGQSEQPSSIASSSRSLRSTTKDKDSSRGAGQGGSEQATSKTDVTSQHQPKLRREPVARTRHIRLRQRLPGHPGRYSLPRGVADRGDHRVPPPPLSATTGGCPTIGAPHPEHTRAVTATSAAHSRHLICTHPAADVQSDTTPAVNRHGSDLFPLIRTVAAW